MSTLAYGVSTVGWPAVTFLSPASQLAAAVLAGSRLAPVQVGWPPTRYRLVIVATSLSSAGSMTQVGWAPGWLAPASSRADRRPPWPRSPARSLLVRVAVHTFWCGWSMSGQSQEIFSGRSRPADRDPGQNGSSVCREEITPPERSCNWAVTAYTPKLLIPWVLARNEAVQEAVAPGATLAEMRNGSPAGIRSLTTPRDM